MAGQRAALFSFVLADLINLVQNYSADRFNVQSPMA